MKNVFLLAPEMLNKKASASIFINTRKNRSLMHLNIMLECIFNFILIITRIVEIKKERQYVFLGEKQLMTVQEGK